MISVPTQAMGSGIMIKAVFFDLYQTLVCYEPPREELQARVLRDFGINVTSDSFRRPMVSGRFPRHGDQ